MAHQGNLLAGVRVLQAPPAQPNLFTQPVSSSNATQPQLRRRSVNYDRNFNIKLSQVSNIGNDQTRDSMLSYSEHAREVTNRRLRVSQESTQQRSDLQIKARTIPKSRFLPRLATLPVCNKSGFPEVTSRKRLAMPRSNTTIPPIKTTSLKLSHAKEKLPMKFASASDLQDIASQNTDTSYAYKQSPHNGMAAKTKNAWIKAEGDPVSTLTVTIPKDNIAGTRNPETTAVRFKLPALSVVIPENEDSGSDDKQPKSESGDDTEAISTASTSDSHSLSETEMAKLKREQATKALLRKAIRQLGSPDSQTSKSLSRLPKLRRKRFKFPSQSLDSIPEDETEDESDTYLSSRIKNSSRDSYSTMSRDNALSLPKSPLETIREYELISAVDIQYKNNQKFSSMCSFEKPNNPPSLPPIRPKAEAEMQWRMLGGSDSSKSRRLQIRAKQKHKPKRIKFLKVNT